MNRCQQGVSLIEVMISITIISLVLGTLIGLQGRMLRRSLSNARSVECIIAVKNFFTEALRYKNRSDYPREKTVSELDLRMTYDRKKIQPSSTLAKLENILIECVEAIEEGRNNQKHVYIKLMLQPLEKPS